jgi:hypothetical protein
MEVVRFAVFVLLIDNGCVNLVCVFGGRGDCVCVNWGVFDCVQVQVRPLGQMNSQLVTKICKGFCFHFLRSGKCQNKNCSFRHTVPPQVGECSIIIMKIKALLSCFKMCFVDGVKSF